MLSPHLPLPGQPGEPPRVRPSYIVHVTATKPQQIGTTGTEGPTWIASSGFRLQNLLSKLYDLPAERIDFNQPGLADKRFDVAMRLPAQESQSSMHRRIVHALEEQLGITIRSVAQIQDVYVVTIVDPKKLPMPERASLGGFYSSTTEFSIPTDAGNTKDQNLLAQLMKQGLADRRKESGIALDSIDMEGSVDELCRTLETGLQHPVLNRTGFRGILKMQIQRDGLDRDQFFNKIAAEFGLAITQEKAQVARIMVQAMSPSATR